MTNHMWKAWFLLGAILLSGSVANAQRRASVTSSLPSGTPIVVRVNEHLSSETARAGDTFSASLAQPLVVNGRTLLSQGTAVTGRVISAQKSGRLSGPGVLELRLVSLGSANISTRSFVIKGASHTKSNVTKIGGSTVAGTVIGAIVGGEKGAAIGAGVGAGAGTAAAAATGKKPATVEAEAVLEFLIGDSPVLTSSAPIYSDREPSDRGNDSRAERFRHADDKDQDDDHDRDTDSRSWDSERYDHTVLANMTKLSCADVSMDMSLRACLRGYKRSWHGAGRCLPDKPGGCVDCRDPVRRGCNHFLAMSSALSTATASSWSPAVAAFSTSSSSKTYESLPPVRFGGKIYAVPCIDHVLF